MPGMTGPGRDGLTTMHAPLICHVVHRLDYGGLENGLVNLINQLPRGAFRHAIVALTDYSDFVQRLQVPVDLHAMHRRSGQDWGLYLRLWRLFRRLRPAIVHTRNLATLEAQLPAALAGVPGRLHGEHGRDVHDLDNTRSRYRWLRRAFRPLVGHYVALSGELENHLLQDIGVRPPCLSRIINGVDAERFRPGERDPALAGEMPFDPTGRRIVGSVGRMQSVKDPLNLARAFAALVERYPQGRSRLALVMVGDGPLRLQVQGFLRERGLEHLAWLPGAREDTPALLRWMDVFVLPSLAEGISNTVLEAMATALPVVATDVGGNAELVQPGRTGALVARAEPGALAAAIEAYLREPARARAHGDNARECVRQRFALAAMVQRYLGVYRGLL